MFIGVLQFELLIHGSESLKDKRRVVRSLKDRLHREHQVSIAEVGLQDNFTAAMMGLAVVSGTERQAAVVLDRIALKLRGLLDAEVGEMRREIIPGDPIAHRDGEEVVGPVWTEEELASMVFDEPDDGEDGEGERA